MRKYWTVTTYQPNMKSRPAEVIVCRTKGRAIIMARHYKRDTLDKALDYDFTGYRASGNILKDGVFRLEPLPIGAQRPVWCIEIAPMSDEDIRALDDVTCDRVDTFDSWCIINH